MECFAGLASTGAGVRAVFDYNRGNFFYDREQRLKMEFALQRFRVAQADLWREDVRDLISLSEYKMHIYLLVNVLLLGFTIVLWCEGRLPSETPDWLMMGSALSISGAFMFLLLSMWLAMHAAVAARSYETRLLTQLVRLPIPSWREIEACRTYGSDFERTGMKQILRLPFLQGRQEGLVRTRSEDDEARPPPISEEEAGTEADEQSSSTSSSVPPLRSRSSFWGASEAGVDSGPGSADPWGFERSGEDIYELGCQQGSQVAKLRHIRLARQAMVYWQTYDAFSRISLSNGINQLLLALSYYILGYILIEVGCRTAATQGVIVLIALAEAMAKLDMSMSIWQLRQMQFLFAFGPIMSLVAASFFSFDYFRVAEVLIVLSFLSHGVLLCQMIRLCYFDPQDHGATLPTTFRGVLYLDVFGWLKSSPRDTSEAAHTNVNGSNDNDLTASSGAGPRPALATIRSAAGRTTPMRPEDLAAPGTAQDMRDLPGAPSLTGPSTQFYGAEFWLPGDAKERPEVGGNSDDGDERSHRDFLPIVTGHEKEVPRILPWRMFCVFAVALSIAWIVAAVHHILVVNHVWDFWDFETLGGETRGTRGALLQTSHSEAVGRDRDRGRGRGRGKRRLPLALLGLGGRSGQRDIRLSRNQLQILPRWPHANVQPVGMSCDASGSKFVVTDGILLYAGQLALGDTSGAPMNLTFEELPCPDLTGEGLQDVSLDCAGGGGGCRAQVLHRQGRRLTACLWGGPGTSASASASSPTNLTLPISDRWLEQVRRQRTAETEAREDLRTRAEKVVALTADPDPHSPCGDADYTDSVSSVSGQGAEACLLVGTTYGRVVRLQHRRGGEELRPTAVVRQGHVQAQVQAQAMSPQTMRGVLAPLGVYGMLGLLEETDAGQVLSVLDSQSQSQSLGAEAAGGGMRIALPKSSPVAAFCAGGGYLHLLLKGASPAVLRVVLPRELALSPR